MSDWESEALKVLPYIYSIPWNIIMKSKLESELHRIFPLFLHTWLLYLWFPFFFPFGVDRKEGVIFFSLVRHSPSSSTFPISLFTEVLNYLITYTLFLSLTHSLTHYVSSLVHEKANVNEEIHAEFRQVRLKSLDEWGDTKSRPVFYHFIVL